MSLALLITMSFRRLNISLLVVVRFEAECGDFSLLETFVSQIGFQSSDSDILQRLGVQQRARESRRGSIISSNAVKDSGWPLCGVALRNRRCSHFSAS